MKQFEEDTRIKRTNHHHQKDELNYKERLIQSLKFGDCIFAKRYDNDIQKDRFGKGHNTGPFIVIGIDNNEIYGMYCTSTDNSNEYIEVAEDYPLFNDKSTYVNVNRIKNISYSQFLTKIKETLSNEDINRLRKKMYLQQYRFYRDTKPYQLFKQDIKIDYDIYDIVSYNGKLYIIIEINEDECTLIPVDNIDKRKSHLDFYTISIDYNGTIKAKLDSLYYINTIASNDAKTIQERYDETTKARKDKSIINYPKEYAKITNSKKTYKKDNKQDESGKIICLKSDNSSQFIVRGKDKNIYKVISIKALLSESKIVGAKLHQGLIKEVHDINPKQIEDIKKHLKLLGNQELSNKVSQK